MDSGQAHKTPTFPSPRDRMGPKNQLVLASTHGDFSHSRKEIRVVSVCGKDTPEMVSVRDDTVQLDVSWCGLE